MFSPDFHRITTPISLPPTRHTFKPITCRATCSPLPSFPSQVALDSGKFPANLYEILRVRQSASRIEIRTAYRNMAKLFHPDSPHQVESDGSDFIEINNAYSTLSDPAARSVYDLSLGADCRWRKYSVYSSGNGLSGFSSTRRWETDQCW